MHLAVCETFPSTFRSFTVRITHVSITSDMSVSLLTPSRTKTRNRKRKKTVSEDACMPVVVSIFLFARIVCIGSVGNYITGMAVLYWEEMKSQQRSEPRNPLMDNILLWITACCYLWRVSNTKSNGRGYSSGTKQHKNTWQQDNSLLKQQRVSV